MKKVNYMLHGADYNPEQWIETKEIWDEDMRLMKKAGVNAVSLGIFSWAELEVSEGEYDFSFMDEIMEKLRENDIKVILATPSGARPVWLSKKYPEVLRVNEDRVRILHSKRHNHCYTSPVYREKTANINRLLAERYKDNPALIGWHISNEYGGECHCELCQKAFRKWLKEKYENDIEKLNHEWWTRFWSHRFSDWDEIESPSVSIGETTIGGLTLDWKRFVTAQTVDFMKNEMKPLREITPNIPITTNMMPLYDGLDYKKFAKEIDMISWDCYPDWHGDEGDIWVGASNAFAADFHRSLKDQSFWLMESTPSIVNWRQVNILKKPGMNKLASLQNVAHGADSVQYFQWRKGRGCSEKFHGAVIDHYGKEDTRVFCDVAEVGESLKKLSEIVRSDVNSEAAILYDTENKWALDAIDGFKRGDKKYGETCIKHYYTFYKLGISMDVITLDQDFSKYKLLIIPMLYMNYK